MFKLRQLTLQMPQQQTAKPSQQEDPLEPDMWPTISGARLFAFRRSETLDEDSAEVETNQSAGARIVTHRSLRQKQDSSPAASQAGGSLSGRLLCRAHQSLGKASGRTTCLSTRRGRLLAQDQQLSLAGAGLAGELSCANFDGHGSNYIQQQSMPMQMPPIQYNQIGAIQSAASLSSSFAASITQKVDSQSAAPPGKHRWIPSRDYRPALRQIGRFS